MTKILGIIGGMSWASTQVYYLRLNELVNERLGRQHSAELLVASIDFQPIITAQVQGDWSAAAAILIDRAKRLEKAGAAAFLISSNTMHRVFAEVAAAVAIPGLNIFDATAAFAKRQGLRQLGLLGTRYTMADPFFVEEYRRRDIEITVPTAADAKRVNEIIFRELIHNQCRPESAQYYQGVVERLMATGAGGVILGCTEIEQLLKPEQSAHPLICTTAAHIEMAAAWLLSPQNF